MGEAAARGIDAGTGPVEDRPASIPNALNRTGGSATWSATANLRCRRLRRIDAGVYEIPFVMLTASRPSGHYLISRQVLN
jgi:hypothetical protein